jgi:hypothetical protein
MIEEEIRGIRRRIIFVKFLQTEKEAKAQERMRLKIVKKDRALDHIKRNFHKILWAEIIQNIMTKEANLLNIAPAWPKMTLWIEQPTAKRRMNEIIMIEGHNKVLKVNRATKKSWNLWKSSIQKRMGGPVLKMSENWKDCSVKVFLAVRATWAENLLGL